MLLKTLLTLLFVFYANISFGAFDTDGLENKPVKDSKKEKLTTKQYIQKTMLFELGGRITKDTSYNDTLNSATTTFDQNFNQTTTYDSKSESFDGPERSYGYGRIKFKDSFKNDKLTLVLDFITERSSYKSQYKVTEYSIDSLNFDSDGNFTDYTFTVYDKKSDINVSFSRSVFQESYFNYLLSDKFSFSGGIKKVSIGQFEPFSTVNMIMPVKFSALGADGTKLGNTLEKRFASVSIYPSQKSSVDVFYFFDDNIDPLLKKAYDQISITEDPNTSEFNNVKYKSANMGQLMVRYMMYFKNSTFGLTYSHGPNLNLSLFARQNPYYTGKVKSAIDTVGDEVNYFDIQRESPIADVLSAEGSIIIKKGLSFKFEASAAMMETSISQTYSTTSIYDVTGAYEYTEYIKQNNGGNINIGKMLYTYGMSGFELKNGNWIYNAGIVFLPTSPQGSSKQNGLIRAENRYLKSLGYEDDDEKTPFFAVVSRKFSFKNPALLTVGRVYSQFFNGDGVFWSQEIGDHLKLNLGVQRGKYAIDSLLVLDSSSDIANIKRTSYSGGLVIKF